MSFPRATIKRFNEATSGGPAPCQYSIKQPEKNVGTIKFEYSGERFKSTDSSLDTSHMGSAKKFAVPAVPTGSSKKRLNFSGTAHKKSEKKNPNPKDSKEVLGHEIAEVQQLMQQCSERESEINRLKIEIQRLEERISSITKDKISLESNAILLEKSIEALTKQNELQLAQAEAEKKRGNGEVESQLLAMKEQSDRDKMKISSLESDLEAARSRISALMDANKVLEQLNADIEKHGRDVSEQVDRLQGLVDGLRDTNGQLQDELDSTRSNLTSIQDGFNEKLQSMLDEGMKECENKTKVANQLVAELKSNMVEADAKVNDLTEKVTLLENENGQSALLNTELQGKVIEFEKRCEELEAAEKSNQDEISHKNAEIDTATEKISTLEAKMETNNEEHKRELKERDERRNEALEESRALKEKLDAVALFEAELSKQISSKTAETVDLRAEIDSLTESNGVLTANMVTAENELKALREEVATKSLKLNELADDKQMMIDRLRETESAMETYKESSVTSAAKCDALEAQLTSANEGMTSVKSREERLRAEVEEMKKNFKQLDSAHQEKITEFTRRILETQKKLNQRENEVKLVADELARYERATDDLNDQLTEHRRAADQELTSTKARNEQLEQEVESMTDEINDLKMALENQSDAKKWKSLYEDLRDQVRPFQSQLDAYSAERAMLLSETSAAHAESTRLGIKYAELLGHQNQKQKIKHIVKIKEESAALKQENMKLRNQNALLTKQVVNARQPTFDPSKAFQHHKENANPN